MKYFATFKGNGKADYYDTCDTRDDLPSYAMSAMELTEFQYNNIKYVSLVDGEVVFDKDAFDAKEAVKTKREDAKQWIKDHKPGIMSLPALNEFVKKLAESMGYE